MRADEFRSGDAIFTVDPSLQVLSWNQGAERLTGISAAEAVGNPCWELLGGLGERGDVVCHARCAHARLAGEGFPVPSHELLVRTARGERARVHVATVGLEDGRLLHLLAGKPSRHAGTVSLTRRQRQVLELMADGLTAKAISVRLRIAETTVRTYIRAILRELGAHSQLEAVAGARHKGLLRG